MVGTAAPKAVAASLPASESLYIQNLNEKLKKHDLKRALYIVFAAHGVVLDVTTVKSSKMRGQAHVLFNSVPAATHAMRQCQGFEFFGRPMAISYAKSRSHTLAKLTGKFVDERTKAPGPASAPSNIPAPPGLPRNLPPPPGLPKSLPPPPGLPSKPPTSLPPPPATAPVDAASPGSKRKRDESDDEGDAPMDMENSDEEEMEMSDDDD